MQAFLVRPGFDFPQKFGKQTKYPAPILDQDQDNQKT
jgi:hypothetical protein